MAKKTVLGKGFDSLLPQDFDESILLKQHERIQKVKLDKLKRQKNQPRKDFDETSIQQLADSIKVHGVLQPLIVAESRDGNYEIIAGERRFRAARIAGLDSVPVIVRTAKDTERLEIALVENIQRVDLSPLEQAASIEYLHQQFNLDYDYIAHEIGKATSTITNQVRLLKLPEKAKEALNKGEISEGHARCVVALGDFPEQQMILIDNIKNLGWSVRRAEQFVIGVKSGHKTEESITKHLNTETEETKTLGKLVAAPVNIRRTAKGGKLEITFKSDEDLIRIIKKLLG